jgi:uncharacterized Rmd1/YagE family protein
VSSLTETLESYGSDSSVRYAETTPGTRGSVSALAVALGERIDLRRVGGSRLGPGEVLVQVGVSGSAFVFRYGCAVIFGASAEEREEFLSWLAEFVHDPFTPRDTEAAEFRVGEVGIERKGEGDVITLDRSRDSLEIAADVLAKSVVLAHYESNIAQAFDRAEPLAVELERSGRVGRRHGGLIRDIASAVLVEQRMVGRIEVTEKPDLLWDRPNLERLHARLVDEYELKERAIALERKLDVVSKTAQLFLNLLYDRRSLRVEWYIVALILVEIFLTIFDLP